MPKTAAKRPADYILPLYINGLSGRVLRIAPAKKYKAEILFIYGHHASLERYFGVAELMSRYAGLTAPDLPGFGGMDSFYKIGEKPSLDNYADYLAAFIKLRFRNKRVIIAGYSLGAAYITRMLQKYPELAKKVDMVISIAGLSHYSDFKFSPRRYWIYRILSRFFSYYLPSLFYKYVVLRPVYIRTAYRYMFNAQQKFKGKTGDRLDQTIEMEVDLWLTNDPRTYMATTHTMLTLDLPPLGHVDLPLYHAGVVNDHYFNGLRVEQHMRMIYKDFILGKIHSPEHAMSVVATAKDAVPFVPREFIHVIKKLG